MAGEERRIFERVSVYIPAQVFDFSGETFLDNGMVVDVSIGGIKMQTKNEYKIGDKILVKFVLEKKESSTTIGMSTKGEVEIMYKIAQGSNNFVGLKFVNMNYFDKEHVRDFIEYKIAENQKR